MFDLPRDLLEAIGKETSKVSHLDLVKASDRLTDRYRQRTLKQNQPFVVTEADRCAYLAVRFPATYAVINRVLYELREKMSSSHFCSLLDLGSGPGTVMWSAVSQLPAIEKISLIEQDSQWFGLGKRLAESSGNAVIKNAHWFQGHLQSVDPFPLHDLITLSYVIGELPDPLIPELISKAWKAASQAIVFIEPGTPDGYQKILLARKTLIDLGAHLVAPCPHALKCPLENGDWCHFSQRLQRSSLHREVKDVLLGFEDEKYSYVIGSKVPSVSFSGRILRHPQKRSGHISFSLCTSEGVQTKIISKRDKEIYKKARKLEWGGSLSV